MCLTIVRPVSVVDCPIRLSKNLQPGLRIAPYKLFKLIFLTNCRLSQYSISTALPAACAFFSFDCSSLRSLYQRFRIPGITPSNSVVKIVPLALSTQGRLLSNISLCISAPLITTVSPVSKSTLSAMSLRCSITASYSSVLKRPSQLPAKLFFFKNMSVCTRSSLISGRICPITVSGAMFNARITEGYSEFKSIEATHLCKPFFGYATYAPAACVASSSRFLRLGTCNPL